ncbi:thioredoxin domain-containing protein 5 homolog [Chironomus tepperi]|uniref:thioredoxin domain-containing protein 5 homolog n=1 Tax=Chironomus tepperi TaxID=113505 RepID=UPI00391EE914
MARLLYFSFLVLLVPLTSAFYISAQNSFILTSENFTQATAGDDYFVLFIEDPESHNKFLELWDEVGQVSQAEESSKHLKFGIVDCHKERVLCQVNQVTKKIQLKFFGNKNSWRGLTTFLESTIADVLREDELIQMFDQPGAKLFVLFKVIYCPYCKETMEEWLAVMDHFKNDPNLHVASLDCTRHREHCKRFDALKFPRMRFIYNPINGKQIVDKYEGDRNAADMIEYAKLSVKRFE